MDIITERRAYNAVSDFIDSHISQGRGGKIAFIDPQRSITYSELHDRSVRFAHALQALGIEPEQRVVLLLNDTVDYPVAFWGTLRAGCVAIPLNVYLTLPQYAYILTDCRVRALVVEISHFETIRPVLDALPHRPVVIVVEDDQSASSRSPSSRPSTCSERATSQDLYARHKAGRD